MSHKGFGLLAFGWLLGCGARTELPGAYTQPSVILRRDVPTVVQRDAIVETADVSNPGRPCGCPGTPQFRVCQLPLMCCPVTRTCEDPARFNCTGSAPPPCR